MMNSNFSWWGSQSDWFSDLGNGFGNFGTNNGQGNAAGTTGNGNFNVGTGNGNNNGGSGNGNNNVGSNNGNNNGVGNVTSDAADAQAAVDFETSGASPASDSTGSFDWRSFLTDVNPSPQSEAPAEADTVVVSPADEATTADEFAFVSTNGQNNTGDNNGFDNVGFNNGNNNGGDNNGNNNVGSNNGNNNGNNNVDASDLPSFDSTSWQDFTADWGDIFA